MAIRRRYDPVRAIGQLSVLAGKAEAQQKQAAIDREMALRAAQMQHQKEMMQFEAKLKLQTQQRAMEWEYQKMEMRSQNDFLLAEEKNKALYMREVAKQLKEMDEYDQAVKTVMESDDITPEQKPKVLEQIKLKRLGYTGVYPRPEKEPAGLSPAGTVSAMKTLEKIPEEPKWWQVTKEGPTEMQAAIKEYLTRQVEQAMRTEPGTVPPLTTPEYKLGTTITRDGKKYKIVGFDNDGMPLVEPI